MSQETLFRTSAFGFNKLDVIEFISVQKKREAELLEEIEQLKSKGQGSKPLSDSDKANELLIANSRIADLKEENQKLEQVLLQLDEKFAYADKALKEQEDIINELNKKLIDSEGRALQAEERAVQAEGRAVQAEERAVQAEEQAIQAQEQAQDALSQTPIKSDCNETEGDSYKSLENQIGMAIIDARLYSERIIKDAKSKSAKISADTYLHINETTSKVEALAKDMDTFKGDFESTLRELGNKLDFLYKNLNSVSSDLIQKINTENEDGIASEAE